MKALHEKVQIELEELGDEVRGHLKSQRDGVVRNMEDLEPKVRRLCEDIGALGPEESKQYKTKFVDIMTDMREMKEILAAQQLEIAAQLSQLDKQKKAQESYLGLNVANDN